MINKIPLARLIAGFLFSLFCLPALGFAYSFETVSIPSSMNPVGSGARALGMGGAFIAIADDATAVSWNPGGLIQLERPEISVVHANVSRKSQDHFSEAPEANSKGEIKMDSLNYLSVAYPFTLKGNNMIVALTYQHLYDFDQKYHFSYDMASTSFSGAVAVDVDRDGDLSAYGIGYCLQLTPRLSLGVTLNIWGDGIQNSGWTDNRNDQFQGTFTASGLPLNETLIKRNQYEFSGINWNLGLLFNVTGNLTIGLVLKTPFTADLKHTSSLSSTTTTAFPPPVTVSTGSNTTDETLDMPASYGVGLAYRFSDTFSMALDFYRTEWDEYILSGQNGDISPVTGLDPDVSFIDPTVQIRMGAEYLFLTRKTVIPFRVGLFLDQAPAEHSPDDYLGFAIGSGFIKEPFVLDAAYQYRFGRDVGSAAMKELGYSKDVDEHIFYVSLIVHF